MKLVRIISPIIICLLVGYLSGIVTRESIASWYVTIEKPSFNPPNWVFAPVWTILFILMGLSAGLILNRINQEDANVKKALSFFLFQLALNALWSFLFFGLQNPLLALVEIVILWLMIFETYTQFKKIDKVAALLLLPYLAWVSFATVLNATIWWLNR